MVCMSLIPLILCCLQCYAFILCVVRHTKETGAAELEYVGLVYDKTNGEIDEFSFVCLKCGKGPLKKYTIESHMARDHNFGKTEVQQWLSYKEGLMIRNSMRRNLDIPDEKWLFSKAVLAAAGDTVC